MYIYNLGMLFNDLSNKKGKSNALFFYEYNLYITYEDLNNKSNKLANFFLYNKIEKEVILILGDKKPETFISILASLKSGNTYSIIDPENPNYRFDKIIETCNPSLIIGDKKFYDEKIDVLSNHKKTKYIDIYSNDFLLELDKFSNEKPLKINEIHGNHPAYIMFTSGSTGTPKGAVMTHNNILNFISWSKEEFNISDKDIFTNVNPLYFDNSVFDIYSSIFNGAMLVPISKEIINNTKKLIDLIDISKCSVWFSVPSLLIYLQTMKAFDQNNFHSLRKIIFGGEGFPKTKLKRLFDLYKERIEFYNVYGPTECTCICSSYKISESDFNNLDGFPSLGKLINNFEGVILDDDLKLVEDNNIGELYLIGPNVGLGYYNDLFRTNERFISNPYSKFFNEKMYKTGDLVKFNSTDQKIYVLGRKDNQIKHMGYRIELEEIEIALSKIKYVVQASVIHSNKTGFSKIKAFIEVEKDNKIDIDKIKQEISLLIPIYMIPTDFIIIDEIPKNANGKIDKNILKEL
ncbi:MAG: amino acid adenylation domain-containing protein [Cyanobacteriota bacterium]